MSEITHYEGCWAEHIECAKTKIAELEALVYVPGIRVCDTCKFSLVSVAFSPSTGQIGPAPNSEEAKCPNCNTTMRLETERAAGNRLVNVMTDMHERFESSYGTLHASAKATQDKLLEYSIGGCTCGTKSNELEHHGEKCLYRAAMTAAALLGDL